MQPQQPSAPPVRNLIAFVLVASLVMFGWPFVSEWLWPTPPKPRPGPPAPPTVSPAEATALAGAVAQMAAAPGLLTGLEAVGPAAVANPPKPPAPPAPEATQLPEPIALGDDSFFVNVRFSPRDGSVDKVFLTKFEEANALGQVARDEHGVPKQLQVVGTTGRPSFQLLHYPEYQKEYPSDRLGTQVWKSERLPDVVEDGKVKESAARFVTTLPEDGIEITKTYRLHPGDYHVGLEVAVRRLPNAPASRPFRYQLSAGVGTPVEGVWYTTIYRNAVTGWTETSGRARRSFEDAASVQWKAGGEKVVPREGVIDYAGVAVQYFASVVAVDDEQPRRNFLEYTRATAETPAIADPAMRPYLGPNAGPDDKAYLGDITVRAVTEPLKLAPGEEVIHKYLLYNGPAKVRLLRDMDQSVGYPPVDRALVDRYENKLRLYTLTDYHWPNFFGYTANALYLTDAILWTTNRMHDIIWWLRQVIPSYALCIITLTVLVRLILLPFSWRQARMSLQMQEQMRALQPQFDELQRKYPNPADYQTLQQEKTQLMFRNGINPLSQMGGCVIAFAQLPILSGLYYALYESIFFRLRALNEHIWWIPNLAAPDMLAYWGHWIPILSDPTNLGSPFYLGPFLNVLPVVSVALMFVQQQMYMPPPTDDVQRQQQTMMKFMTVFMGVMFYKVAAGVCIYFIVSSAWGFAERSLLPKPKKPGDPDESAPRTGGSATTASPPPGGRGGPAAPSQERKSFSKKARQQRKQDRAREQEKTDAAADTFVGKLKAWWERVLEEARKK